MSFGDSFLVAEIDRRAQKFPASIRAHRPGHGGGAVVTAAIESAAPLRTAILIIGHGSREASARTRSWKSSWPPIEARLRARRESTTVAHAYVELARPLVDDALAALASSHRRVVVVPLFLFLVGHAKNDIPIALTRARAAHPEVDFVSGAGARRPRRAARRSRSIARRRAVAPRTPRATPRTTPRRPRWSLWAAAPATPARTPSSTA